MKPEVRELATMSGTANGRLLALLVAITFSIGTGPSYAQSSGAAGGPKADDELTEIVVTAYRITRGSVGSLVEAPIEEVPRNMLIVDEKKLTDQMVDNTLDVFKNFAGLTRGSDSPGGEHPRMRGQGAYQFLEGTYSGNVIWDSAEFLGAAEVLSGPNSIQFGFLSQGGGTVNFRLKRPLSIQAVDVSVKMSSFGDRKYVYDANMPFGTGEGDGVRVIGVHQDIQGYWRGFPLGQRNSQAIMLTYSGFLGIKADLDFETMYRRSPSDSPITFTANPVAGLPEIDPRNTTEQRWALLKRDGQRIGAKLTRPIGAHWTAVALISSENQDVLNKSCTTSDPNLATGEGKYSCGTFGFDVYSNASYRLDMLGKFKTFGLAHFMTIGASQLRQFIHLPMTFDDIRILDPNGVRVTQNIYNPRQYAEPLPTLGGNGSFNGTQLTQWWKQAYFQDLVRVNNHWDFWLGANAGRYHNSSGDNTGETVSANINGVSPSGSVTYSPTKGLRMYATYADVISPGGTAPLSPNYVNAGERFPTLRLKSYEFGAKKWWGDRSLVTLNFFDSTAPSEYSKLVGTDAAGNNLFLYTQSGKNEYTGIEFSESTTFRSGLSLDSGLVYMTSSKKVNTGNPALDGKDVAGLPRRSVSVHARYLLPSRPSLTLTGAVNYNGPSPLLETGGYNIPGYTLLDVGAQYEFSGMHEAWTLRANLQNALDTRYYSPYSSSVVPGAPRTLWVELTGRFGTAK